MSQTAKEKRIANYLLAEMIRTQACLELVAAKVYFKGYDVLVGQGVSAKVSGKALELAQEEMEHFRLFRRLHEKRWGNLDESVARRIAAIAPPGIEDEADFLAARWIVDGTGLLQMRHYTGANWPEYMKAIRATIKDECRHKGEGKRAFVAAAKRRNVTGVENLAAYARKWLAVGFISLGSSDSVFDQMSVDLKLKKRHAVDLKRMLEKEVVDTLAALGL